MNNLIVVAFFALLGLIPRLFIGFDSAAYANDDATVFVAGMSWLAFAIAVVIMFIAIINFVGELTNQRHDQNEIVYHKTRLEMWKKRWAAELKIFGSALLHLYPKMEKQIFEMLTKLATEARSEGASTDNQITSIAAAHFPELHSAETVLELVNQLTNTFTEMNDAYLDVNRIVLRMKNRRDDGWTLGRSFLPKAKDEYVNLDIDLTLPTA